MNRKINGSSRELFDEVIEAGLCSFCGACSGACPYLVPWKGKIRLLDNCTLIEGRCYQYCPRTYMDMDALSDSIFGVPYPENELGVVKKILLSMEAICSSMGIRVEIRDPFDLEETTSTLLDMINNNKGGARVLIMRRECELIRAKLNGPPYNVYIDADKCLGEACGCNRYCNTAFTYQALLWDKATGKARIDEVICAGCGLCADICPQGAIIREAI